MSADDRPPTETFSEDTRDLATSPGEPAGKIEVPERFEVRATLGRGGMGIVVEAHDRILDRDVAVKVIAAERRYDPRFRERLVAEARAAARLRHPGVIAVHDVSPDGAFIVMELVRGESLRDRLDRERALPARELRRIAHALLDALAAAHALGVIHRDVKPANVLIAEDGTIKLADFGIASVIDGGPISAAGTPGYTAPEQLVGARADARADVYAVGATLFEAATGARPQDVVPAERAAALRAKLHHDPLVDAILRSLAEDPAGRHPSAAAFARDLDARPRPSRRWLALGGIVAAAGVAAAIVLAVPTRPSRPAAPPAPEADPFAAFLAGDLYRAEMMLRQAATADPTDGQVHTYLAIAAWWRTASDDAVRHELDLAEAGTSDAADHAAIAAMRAVLARDFAGAAAAAEPFAGDPLLDYLLMEARFHRGDGGVAIDGFRVACARAPGLRIGNLHALTYYASHGDADGLAWAIPRQPETERALWDVRALMVAHRLDDAWKALVALDDRNHATNEALSERIALRARRGDVAGALEMAETEPFARGGELVGPVELALHVALDDGEAAAARRLLVDEMHGANTATWERRMVIEAVVRIESLRGAATAAEVAPLLDADLAPSGESATADMARALIAGATGDRAHLATLAAGPITGAAAAARAFLAELDGDPARAMSEWRTAIRADGTGTYVIPGSYHLARVARAAGDVAAVRAACADVVEPGLFDWSWVAAAPPCRAWIAATR